jgi:hypothetical protein
MTNFLQFFCRDDRSNRVSLTNSGNCGKMELK